MFIYERHYYIKTYVMTGMSVFISNISQSNDQKFHQTQIID